MKSTSKVASLIAWAETHERAAAGLRAQIQNAHPSARPSLERTLAYRDSEASWARAEADALTGAQA